MFKRLLFGLKISGAKFTRALRKALAAWLLRNVKISLDDILIHSKDLQEHLDIKREY